ncbi:hypothetical protein SAY87_004032 [Trapa incisa]|uniref:Uncharacterized protein n=1 Tax=Trapa incisa TaxID=236973 RepID=A0AAN7JNT8_9MYRT|nr:hypothetical protein SAY87_004032 [Trapa incisa]
MLSKDCLGFVTRRLDWASKGSNEAQASESLSWLLQSHNPLMEVPNFLRTSGMACDLSVLEFKIQTTILKNIMCWMLPEASYARRNEINADP